LDQVCEDFGKAAGGSWNASIVAEVAIWGATKLEATGLGSYIAKATEVGGMSRVVLGITVVSAFVGNVNSCYGGVSIFTPNKDCIWNEEHRR
jgi:ABC-type anion transport system duplicated permease subunit